MHYISKILILETIDCRQRDLFLSQRSHPLLDFSYLRNNNPVLRLVILGLLKLPSLISFHLPPSTSPSWHLDALETNQAIYIEPSPNMTFPKNRSTLKAILRPFPMVLRLQIAKKCNLNTRISLWFLHLFFRFELIFMLFWACF